MSDVQLTFRADLVWIALIGMLKSGMSFNDIAPVSENDFEGDDLVLDPPSIRTFFAGESSQSTSDAQALSYDATNRFIAICGDTYAGDAALQALASLKIACDVKEILAGARIKLSSGETSEPVRCVSIEPYPVRNFGTAYAASFEVPGLAQFPDTNATPKEI